MARALCRINRVVKNCGRNAISLSYKRLKIFNHGRVIPYRPD